MKLSNVKIQKYMATVSGDKKSVAWLLLSGNPNHVNTVPADLLKIVKREISLME